MNPVSVLFETLSLIYQYNIQISMYQTGSHRLFISEIMFFVIIIGMEFVDSASEILGSCNQRFLLVRLCQLQP